MTFSPISERIGAPSISDLPEPMLAPAPADSADTTLIIEDTRSPNALHEWVESSDAAIQTPGKQPSADKKHVFFNVFLSTFFTIFLAELGDKTQIATLLMSAESHAPWIVFAGAATALIATSLIGVLVGHWLSSRLSPKTLDNTAGMTLLMVSVLLTWDVLGGS